MEWLLAHDGQELPPEVKAEVATAVEEAASSLQVRSFVCNEYVFLPISRYILRIFVYSNNSCK